MTPSQDALRAVLDPHVADGSVPGLVALVGTADREDVVVLGRRAVDGPDLTRDSLFRIASSGKPFVAAATMVLVERGLVGLDEPVGRLLPELAEPRVLRDPAGPVDDTVPAVRPITVRQLLTFTAGHGFPTDFGLPVVQLLFGVLRQGPPQPQAVPPPDEWMRLLAGIPLLHQPGEGWTYNTGSDILGVLLARAAGMPLPELLEDTLFEPLGMRDTRFHVPAAELPRFTTFYRHADVAAGQGPAGLVEVDPPDGQWSLPPAFPSGAGGLVSTADDWLAFGRMLLAAGRSRTRRVLSEDSVRLMLTDQLTAGQRRSGELFLEGQGWGFGGSVDVDRSKPWTVPGRYGWVGGTGTGTYVDPAAGTVTVLLTQVELTGPAAPHVLQDFWTAAAG